MHKPITIQKSEKLNTVYATDEPGPGGANHTYIICRNDKNHRIEYPDGSVEIHTEPDAILTTVQMQCGPRRILKVFTEYLIPIFLRSYAIV